MIDYGELERLASEATGGPWVLSREEPRDAVEVDLANGGRGLVADTGDGDRGSENVPNAAFIAAANPEVVKKLLAELTRLRLKDMLNEVGVRCGDRGWTGTKGVGCPGCPCEAFCDEKRKYE